MKNPLNKKTNKFLLISFLLVIIGVFLCCYIYFTKNNTSTPTDKTSSNLPDIKSPTTKEQKDAGTQIKEDAIEGKDDPTKEVTSDTSITITAAQQNGQIFQIRTLINKIVQSGTCTLVLTKNGTPSVTKTAEIQSLSNSSTCKGFDIPTSELTPGNWNVEIIAKMTDTSTKVNSVITVE